MFLKYDTISVWVPRGNLVYDYDERIVSVLKDISTIKASNGDFILKGWYSNMRVEVKATGVRVGGSANRFFTGSTLDVGSINSCSELWKGLFKALLLPIGNAVITRLDVNADFILRHPPRMYLCLLDNYPGHERLDQCNGIAFKKGRYYDVVLYDKVKEMKATNQRERGKLTDNILRYEYRFNAGNKKFLKFPILTADMIFLPNVIFEIALLVKLEFFKISWRNSDLLNVFLSTGKIKNNDFVKLLAFWQVDKMGLSEVFLLISNLNADRKFKHSSYAAKLKKTLKQGVQNIQKISIGSPLMDELSSQVDNSYFKLG